MSKRGRGRGGLRGGRGRPNRGGRGGYIGGKKNKYNKNRNRGGHNRNGPNGGNEFPELMDMNNPDFISVSNPESSMRAAAARRSRGRSRLQDEAFNTDDNMENTMKLPLRKRPVGFVKSSTYDPSKDLIRKLREKEEYLAKVNDDEVTFLKEEAKVENDEKDVAKEDDLMEIDQEEFENCEDNGADEVEIIEEHTEGHDTQHELEESSVVFIKEAEVNKPHEALQNIPKPIEVKKVAASELASIPDDDLFFRDEEGDSNIEIKVSVTRDSNHTPSYTASPQRAAPLPAAKSCTEFNPTLSIGHVYLPTAQTSNGDVHTSLPKGKATTIGFNPDQSIYELEDGDEDLLDFNKSRNKDLYQSYNKYISRVLHNLAGNSDDEDDEDNENVSVNVDEQYDQDMFAELDEDFEEEANFIANIDDSDLEEENEGVIPAGDKTADQFNKLNIEEGNGKEGEKEPEEPEYGFLAEDYESFDNASVEVINIRYGAGANQYFMKSFRLTGSYDYAWIDQELFQDLLLDNGMPEHRLNAYFKYIQAQLAPVDELDEKDFDLPISDSSEAEDEEDEIQDGVDDYDDEGLDDLISFTTKFDDARNLEFNTQTLKTRGKGRKKELNLDHIADDDLRQSLANQYQAQIHFKRDKKKNRENNIAREHSASQDLSLKYPFTIYVNDFRNEFEEFLHDSKRNAITFPPLDPHGNKVVMKFAYLFNMKSRKFGQGKQQHVVAVKNKRTFHSLPDYHSVELLCKQRPVFNRIDQKRPRVEIEAEEAKSSRRGRPSKAHVKEGDIVGANAPEIACDNIGRRLLEKLGWKAGQGLGSENRGIPEPVVAKVKKTKLGLR